MTKQNDIQQYQRQQLDALPAGAKAMLERKYDQNWQNVVMTTAYLDQKSVADTVQSTLEREINSTLTNQASIKYWLGRFGIEIKHRVQGDCTGQKPFIEFYDSYYPNIRGKRFHKTLKDAQRTALEWAVFN